MYNFKSFVEGENYFFDKGNWNFSIKNNEVILSRNEMILHCDWNEMILFSDDDSVFCSIVFNYLIKNSGFWAKCTKIEDDGTVWVSIKEYQKEQLQEIEDGTTIEVTIIFVDYNFLIVEKDGVFFKINKTEVSITRFKDLKDVYHKNQTVLVYILDKENGMVSIKWAYRDLQEYMPYRRGDLIMVTVGLKVSDKSGYFVEVTPHVTAIMDCTEHLTEGEKVICMVKGRRKNTIQPKNDLKLNFISKSSQ